VASCRVNRLRIARRGPVAPAVIGRAEIRAALDHLSRNTRAGLGRIAAQCLGDTTRVARRAARPVGIVPVTGRVPVFGPLPDIAGWAFLSVWGTKCREKFVFIRGLLGGSRGSTAVGKKWRKRRHVASVRLHPITSKTISKVKSTLRQTIRPRRRPLQYKPRPIPLYNVTDL
jgi:hypothetical protein